MKNHYIPITSLVILLFLSACSAPPPNAMIQTAVAETQTAMPAQTAYPTYTPYPTESTLPPTNPTKNPYFESFSIRLFPGIEASLIYISGETGTEIWLDFPKDVTSQPARAMFIPGLTSSYPPSLVYNGDAFELLTGPGDQMNGFKSFTYNAPISVTIKFSGSQNVAALALYHWTGVWEKIESACNLPSPTIDTINKTITTSICSPGGFAIFSRNGN